MQNLSDVMAHIYNLSTQKVEAGGLSRIQGQARLQSMFQANQATQEDLS